MEYLVAITDNNFYIRHFYAYMTSRIKLQKQQQGHKFVSWCEDRTSQNNKYKYIVSSEN